MSPIFTTVFWRSKALLSSLMFWIALKKNLSEGKRSPTRSELLGQWHFPADTVHHVRAFPGHYTKETIRRCFSFMFLSSFFVLWYGKEIFFCFSLIIHFVQWIFCSFFLNDWKAIVEETCKYLLYIVGLQGSGYIKWKKKETKTQNIECKIYKKILLFSCYVFFLCIILDSPMVIILVSTCLTTLSPVSLSSDSTSDSVYQIHFPLWSEML